MWTCPRCDRGFGRAQQSHVCVPGTTLVGVFARHPTGQREAFDAVLAWLEDLGPLHVDAVDVGVFLKAERKVAELRPMSRWLALSLYLPRTVQDRRVTRHIPVASDRVVHVIRLTGAADVDGTVQGWLTEAYDASS